MTNHPSPVLPKQALFWLTIISSLIFACGCNNNQPEDLLTLTSTSTSTITVTVTPLPTVTPRPSRTPTKTHTPPPTTTATPSETPAELRPAQLWLKRDVNNKVIDWAYSHITDIDWDSKGQVIRFSATLSFQLMDRGIHRETITIIGKNLTIYYLNIRRQVGTDMQTARLIVGGTFGKDVPMAIIPAGGPSYVKLRLMDDNDPFDPYLSHVTANLPFEDRSELYPDVFLTSLEQVIAQLPDQFILLTDQPIIVDPDSVQRFEYDIQTVSSLMARFYPWMQLDDYDRFTGPNQAALYLADYLYLSKPIPTPIEWYSGESLILILGPN
ncbi:MAG: hypothetical protein JW704_02990 [Anaerolineaceae bacterium]|nr:hypothetical protein [Anaerolineaceae bacterium]MBN2678452.1 hypothetical protein [Anaerolineaceae bacterium]